MGRGIADLDCSGPNGDIDAATSILALHPGVTRRGSTHIYGDLETKRAEALKRPGEALIERYYRQRVDPKVPSEITSRRWPAGARSGVNS